MDRLQRCEQTPEILVAGFSLSQMYATVRVYMYMIHRNQILKVLRECYVPSVEEFKASLNGAAWSSRWPGRGP